MIEEFEMREDEYRPIEEIASPFLYLVISHNNVVAVGKTHMDASREAKSFAEHVAHMLYDKGTDSFVVYAGEVFDKLTIATLPDYLIKGVKF